MTLDLGALPDPYVIEPLGGRVDASVRIPGSKSITNRALACAALAHGQSVLRVPLDADDTQAMVACVTALGANVDQADVDAWVVEGCGGAVTAGPVTVDARQSGTTSRFVSPMFALGLGEYCLDGHAQLQSRPFGDLVDAMRSMGLEVDSDGGLPLTVRTTSRGRGAGMHEVELAADVSSQFASGLLMVGPCLREGLDLTLTGEVISQPYLDLTVAIMRAFGAEVTVDGTNYVVAPTGYIARDYVIEPDASAASYFFAIAGAVGGRIQVEGLGRDSLQGDTGFVRVLEAMGARVEQNDVSTRVCVDEPLKGVTVDMRQISDTAPTLAALAPGATSATTVTGIDFIRHKESDRIAGPVTELMRLGIEASDNGDGFTVLPGTVTPAIVETYDDHRMAMSFAVLGAAQPGVSVANPSCVAKTFPGFFETFEALRSTVDMASSLHHSGDLETLNVIAIDGPAGSGKSTVARLVAQRLGLEYLDTGAMYRAVAFAAISQDIDPANTEDVAALVATVSMELGIDTVIVNGIDATTQIRGPEVTQAVTAVAANPVVRIEMQRQQREWVAARAGAVVEGRDIGSAVFPDAPLKIYLTARSDVRAERRGKEDENLDYDAIATDLARRDMADSSRAHTPLMQADGAIVVETSMLDVEGVVDEVLRLHREVGKG
ncbi:MAG: 3-phosphoshikimate 1-carboxyvinyltransferase [Acidimicrobiales bacterium]